MVKKEDLVVLGLRDEYTDEELNNKYTNIMLSIRKQGNINNDAVRKAVVINESYRRLREKAIKVCNKNGNSNLYSDSIYLNKVGLTLEEVRCLYRKQMPGSYKDIDDFVDKISVAYELKLPFIKFSFSQMYISENTWLVPSDRLFSIYFADSINIDSFDEYISILANMCKQIEDIVGINNFSIETEFKEFNISKTRSFMKYIETKLAIVRVCKELGIEEYKLRHEFNYEAEFRGTFLQFLKNKLFIKVIKDESNMSDEELQKYYAEYKKASGKISYTIYDFAAEYYSFLKKYECTMDSFIADNRKYLSKPEEKRVSTFSLWYGIRSAEAKTGLTSEQLLEHIFLNALSKGYKGDITDFFIYASDVPLKERKK